MDARIAAELLYESEATLRMVDTVLDELRVGETEPASPPAGMWAVRPDEEIGGDLRMPPEFCVRGYWQVHELLDCLRQVREMIGAERQQTELSFERSPARPDLDHVLSLLDAVDSLDDEGSAGQRARLVAELRSAVGGLIGGPEAAQPLEPRDAAALALLAEAEARLTRLGHLFETGDPSI